MGPEGRHSCASNIARQSCAAAAAFDKLSRISFRSLSTPSLIPRTLPRLSSPFLPPFLRLSSRFLRLFSDAISSDQREYIGAFAGSSAEFRKGMLGLGI